MRQKNTIGNLTRIIAEIKSSNSKAIEKLNENCFEVDFHSKIFSTTLSEIVDLIRQNKLNANQKLKFSVQSMQSNARNILIFTPLSIALCCSNLVETNRLLNYGANPFDLLDFMRDSKYKKLTNENLDFVGETIRTKTNPISMLFCMIYELESKKDERGRELLKRILLDKDENGKNIIDHLQVETLLLLLTRAENNQGFLRMFAQEIFENSSLKTKSKLSAYHIAGLYPTTIIATKDLICTSISSTSTKTEVEPLKNIAAREINKSCRGNTLLINTLFTRETKQLEKIDQEIHKRQPNEKDTVPQSTTQISRITTLIKSSHSAIVSR